MLERSGTTGGGGAPRFEEAPDDERPLSGAAAERERPRHSPRPQCGVFRRLQRGLRLRPGSQSANHRQNGDNGI